MHWILGLGRGDEKFISAYSKPSLFSVGGGGGEGVNGFIQTKYLYCIWCFIGHCRHTAKGGFSY